MQCSNISTGSAVIHPEFTPEQCSAQGVGYVVVADSTDIAAQAITADQIGYAFGFGFGAVFLFWSLGYVVGVAKRVIRLA